MDPAGELGFLLGQVRREKSIEILSQPKPSILAEAIYVIIISKKNSNWLKASSKELSELNHQVPTSLVERVSLEVS